MKYWGLNKATQSQRRNEFLYVCHAVGIFAVVDSAVSSNNIDPYPPQRIRLGGQNGIFYLKLYLEIKD
jgi:hypothetical protein